MPTPRTQAYLVGTTFAGGQPAGSIDPGDMQDFVVSTLSYTYGATTSLPINYGTITDGGTFGDGLTHPASANGFSTLAALQTQFRAASFTATGSGTNLTVSSVTGAIYPGLILGVTTGIGSGIKIVSQTSGTTGGAGVYVTSSATTISAAAATASWAGATSDDMAGLMIQAAIHAAHLAANGSTIYLPAGSYILAPFGVALPPNTTAKLTGDNYYTVLLCQNCTGSGAVCIYTNAVSTPVSHISLFGLNAGRNFGNATNGGTPYTGMYTSGTVGLYLSQVSTTILPGIHIFNFDNAYGWDLVNGNNYSLTFRDSAIQGNNRGVSIGASAPNSNEAMRWIGCSISNNNIGIYVIAQSSATPGAGSAYGMDVYIDKCQIDYNIVNAVYYLGFGAGSLSPSAVILHMCHIETGTTCSGTGVWCATDGIFMMDKCFCYSATGTPLGVVGFLGFYSQFNGSNNITPGTFGNGIPLLYAASANAYAAFLSGNVNQLTVQQIMATSPAGSIYGTVNFLPGYSVLTSNYTFQSLETSYKQFQVGASINITVPLNSTLPLAIGTSIQFTSLPTFTGTFVATGGVTITTSGAGLTFGGAKPATVFLTKTATNTWLATGQMT